MGLVLAMLVGLAATPGPAAGADGDSPGDEAPDEAAICDQPGANPLTGPWQHPVAAPVVDWFRPPSHPYGAGNRGLEYATANGDPVVAVDDGSVTFAGPVGLSRFVVVEHDGGLRSTSAYLDRIDVAVGDTVLAGQGIATAAEGFHLTARLDGSYLDPMTLIGGSCFVVRLVPIPAPAR